jgi:hypothetical protein
VRRELNGLSPGNTGTSLKKVIMNVLHAGTICLIPTPNSIQDAAGQVSLNPYPTAILIFIKMQAME